MKKPSINLPRHLALIPDGNRRWAKEHGVDTEEGYGTGLKRIWSTIEECRKLGIKIFTAWLLSTDNITRKRQQVKGLVESIEAFLREIFLRFHKKEMRVRFLGRRDRLPKKFLKLMEKIEKLTRNNNGLVVNFAIDYGGRDELCRAIQKITQDIQRGSLKPKMITEEVIANYLDTAGLPDPDLIIRTSGEMRLSGYLSWQLGYAELVFVPVLFPDFTRKRLRRALLEYSKRERRFGGG